MTNKQERDEELDDSAKNERLGQQMAFGFRSACRRSGVYVLEYRIKWQGHAVTCVMKGDHAEEGAVVCFSGAATLHNLFNKLVTGVNKDTLKWREDRPYTPES